MDSILNEAELLNLFRPNDRKRVDIPAHMVFPFAFNHYVAWVEPAGNYVYLVFKKPSWKNPVGVTFRRTNGSVQSPSRMCDWCHSCGPSSEIGLLSVTIDPNTTIGMMLCLDLSCINKLETVAGISGKNFEKLAEGLFERMNRFIKNAIKTEEDRLH